MGAILLRADRILLVQRGRPPAKGCWSLPGGVLRAGERLREGICREVAEETGLEVVPLGVFEVFERLDTDKRGRLEYHYVLVDFLCRVTGGKLRPADDASAAKWIRRAELSLYPITEGTLDVIRRAFRKGKRGILST